MKRDTHRRDAEVRRAFAERTILCLGSAVLCASAVKTRFRGIKQ